MFDHSANGPDCWKCSLHIEWHDCSFCPAIRLRQGIEIRRGATAKPLPGAAILPHPVRRPNLAQPMKKIGNRKPPVRHSSAFTLIELLVVISIIGLLAGMLLPVVSRARVAAQKMKAKTEISGLVTAIEGYDAAYGRFPVSTNAQYAATAVNGDFTYGGTYQTPSGSTPVDYTGYSYNHNNYNYNAEVVQILMDITNTSSINWNHIQNPQQTKFLSATPVADKISPGVGTDGVYRDPWGNPYIISMDLNFDENCWDAFYGSTTVSAGGLNGLTLQNGNTVYGFRGKVMVWSAGPDGKIDPNLPANKGANRDNVISWQ